MFKSAGFKKEGAEICVSIKMPKVFKANTFHHCDIFIMLKLTVKGQQNMQQIKCFKHGYATSYNRFR